MREHVIPKSLKCSNSAPKIKEDTKWLLKGFLFKGSVVYRGCYKGTKEETLNHSRDLGSY